MRKLLLLGGLLFIGGLYGWSQTGCPDCEVTLPDELDADTIYIDPAPDGQAGQAYSADISFRMPLTTTPVANAGEDIPPGFDINQITILSVTNMPPGLSWEANQTVFTPTENTDGCVRFCGTPLLAGEYNVEVVVTAQVFVFAQTTSITIPLTILPAQSVTEGFTLSNTSACGELTVDLTNNIPSNGAEGFSYSWDFGNGDTSSLENPAAVTYSDPGTYNIDYEAVIDTTGYFLTNVLISTVGCSDILGRPDLKINVFDPAGEYIYTAPIVDNTNPPINFATNIELEEGTYRIQVVDDDGGIDGADEDCGNIFITRETGSEPMVDGELTLSVSIIHPVDTVRSVDSVTVFPQPAVPELDPTSDQTICAGDSLSLMVINFDTGLTWFRDSLPLVLPDTAAIVMVADSGSYYVRHVSPDGCRSSSESVRVDLLDPPLVPTITQFENLIEVADTASLPPGAILTWYADGTEAPQLAGATRFCVPKETRYTLFVTDPETGCVSQADFSASYDPSNSCNTATEDLFANNDFRLYPNPAADWLRLEATSRYRGVVELTLLDLLGRPVQTTRADWPVGPITQNWRVSTLPAGTYLLRIRTRNGVAVLPWVKR